MKSSNRSLRWRLLMGSTISTTLILATLGAAIFISMRHSLVAQFDALSLAKARALAQMTEQHGSRVKFESEQQLPEFSAGDHPEYFELRLDNGSEVTRSPTLGSNHLPPTDAPAALILPDGRPGRTLTLRFAPQIDADEDEANQPQTTPHPTAIVVVARESAELDSTLDRLRWLLVTLVGLAVCVSDVVLAVVVNRALRPMRQVAREIESFPEDDLSRRVDSQGVPAELAPVVERLNGLLGRLEAAFGRERAFTADVAHELRTPLAGLHTTLEVCRSKPRDPETYQNTIDKCLAITGGLRSMIQTLLLLARADAGQLPVRHEAVDLSELMEECWQAFEQRAAERGLHIERRLARPCVVQTDSEKLRIVMNNLFDNAVSHADAGGSVRITSTADADRCTIEIANTGSGADSVDSSEFFRRFWRGDQSRSANGQHCGLGLSLCQRLLGLTGDEISARSNDGVFTVRIVTASRSRPRA